jgi:hypothetical protein
MNLRGRTQQGEPTVTREGPTRFRFLLTGHLKKAPFKESRWLCCNFEHWNSRLELVDNSVKVVRGLVDEVVHGLLEEVEHKELLAVVMC